jgi:23S rRNA (uridine2552-2'-O)-methyltransferase
VDLKPIEPFPQEYIRTIVADFTEPAAVQQIMDFLPRKADVVLSDASPNISGIWELDNARQIDLAGQALKIALSVLRPHGNFFVKVFEGNMLPGFLKKVKKHFEVVKVIKPKASRAKSSEMYLLAMKLKTANHAEEQN